MSREEFLFWRAGDDAPFREASAWAIRSLCSLAEDVAGEDPDWLRPLLYPASVVEYERVGPAPDYPAAEVAAGLRRLRELAAEHGERWARDERWKDVRWSPAELLDWLDATIAALDSYPPGTRVSTIEQYG